MRGPKPNARRGNALIEFTLLGIPLLFITISIISISLDMWEFHNLAYVTGVTARYITMHGATCSQSGNICTVTVGNIATYYKTLGIGLDPSVAALYLTDGSGTTTCNPVNNCLTTNTQFPSSSHNSVGSNITVKSTYVLKNPFFLYWPPDVDKPNDFTVAATSQQMIVF
jgi:Flp pilus assembly protein TadG